MDNPPKIILITGPPTVGKTALSHLISNKLHIKRVVDLDTIRDVLKDREKNPYLNCYSTTAWRITKKNPTEKEIIKSYKEYCNSLKIAVESIISSAYKFRIDTIIEGVHLIPELYSKYRKKKNFYFIIMTADKKRYEKNIQKRIKEGYGESKKELLIRLDKILLINSFFTTQATKYSLFLIKNFSIKKCLKEALQRIK